ncbi:MAG: hypothetical protein PGN07_05055 [Aeromicrobium erythreum]
MHTRLGWVTTVVGAVCLLAGLAVMVVLGPDSRFTTGPHEVDTDASVIVTEPGVVSWSGLRVDVLAEVPVGKPVFVGVGNSVDVQNYVRGVQRVEVTSFRTPWKVTTRQVSGRPALPGAPTALDWWIADSAGLGGASVGTTLPDETVSVAILAVGSTNLSGLEVTMAYGIEGGFTKGLAVALVGLAALWAGRELRRGRHLLVEALDRGDDADEGGDDVEYRYVYVDEDGVEHEISAAEAARMEAEDDVETLVEVVEPEPAVPADGASRPRSQSEREVPPGSAGGSGDEQEPAVPEPEPSVPEPGPSVPEPEPSVLSRGPRSLNRSPRSLSRGPRSLSRRPSVPGPVDGTSADDAEPVYVIVDDDGVEREISAAELAELEARGEVEVVDDDPDGSTDGNTSDERPVTYVIVDDDGVEREISAAELAELEARGEVEVVDDEEEGR